MLVHGTDMVQSAELHFIAPSLFLPLVNIGTQSVNRVCTESPRCCVGVHNHDIDKSQVHPSIDLIVEEKG